MRKALVILSGGQDSVTCLAWAHKHYDSVEAITFQYGQRHEIELECARNVCTMTDTPHKVVDMSFFSEIVVSALTGSGNVSDSHPFNADLPASFVPNRNAMFFTVAHAWAQTIGATDVVTGVCQTDYSGYPDCRETFVMGMQNVLHLGSEQDIAILTPLMYLTKAETFAMADDLGELELVLENSHTCYEGDRTKRHDWGYGCGECPACKLRSAGWEAYLVEDKT